METHRMWGAQTCAAMGVWLCMSVKNLPIYAKGKGKGRNRSKLFKACNYVCVMRRKKAEPCSYEGISPPCCCSHYTESGIMLERKKSLSATQTYWRLHMGRGVSQVRVFCAPSRVFPPRISDEEWQLSLRGKLWVDYANKCHPHGRLTRREQALMCGWSPTYVQKWGQKKCRELTSQAQIKSRLFAAVQHLEKYTIMRIIGMNIILMKQTALCLLIVAI